MKQTKAYIHIGNSKFNLILTTKYLYRKDLNMSYPKYTNGYGQPIYNPKAYYKAVREDRYGYNRNKKR